MTKFGAILLLGLAALSAVTPAEAKGYKVCIERPSFERPVFEKGVRERSVFEKSVRERPVFDKSVFERGIREKSVAERSVMERSVYDVQCVRQNVKTAPAVRTSYTSGILARRTPAPSTKTLAKRTSLEPLPFPRAVATQKKSDSCDCTAQAAPVQKAAVLH